MTEPFEPNVLAALDQESAAMKTSLDELLAVIRKNLVKDGNEHLTVINLARSLPHMCHDNLDLLCLYAASALIRLTKESGS